jgi:glycosyl-4,4'-diaponeurosporenoate acyltransferase
MLGLVLVDSLVWLLWSALVGFGLSKVPPGALVADRWVTRLRPIERDGRAYERLRIRRWKDLLPEAGSAFGGQSKRHLLGSARPDLERFAAETRRAELVHWSILAATPLFGLWNPAPLFAGMVAYGVFANVPCIAIQRYNRARIQRVVARRQRAVPA